MAAEASMTDVAEYELEPEPHTTPPPVSRPPSLLPWVAAVVVLAGAIGAFLYLRPSGSGGAAGSGLVATESPVEPHPPLGVDVEPIELPPLDQTDTLVRDLVRALSSHPRVAAWLATDGLIRNFVVVTHNIAAGRSPSRFLAVLKPAQPFAVAEANGIAVVDVRSYDRYNDIASAVASIDTAGAARLYSTLKPRILDAYAELGEQGAFDAVLERAMARLLMTPVVEGEMSLVPRGALYQFNDSRIEQLSAAQKHLVRMGPRNMRTIQRKLRDVAQALGVPAERLPPR